jgi:uncharacterized protein HemX
MARKCTAPGCGFYLPDKYPLTKCPWHMAPGRGAVKLAAALAIAAAGLGGGFAYKRFRRYLDRRKLRRESEKSRRRQAAQSKEQKAASIAGKRAVKSAKLRSSAGETARSRRRAVKRKKSRGLSQPL